ncbi:MAG: protein-L-isoaspartate(D-aspartate) O-methyltransferase [Lentimicrobiaceae bacterium]|jgi:protein-L-isoaspartate(D-aspartate) O-methyltransferase|nr:protein-L-isoaspartate(D-aspartate) O-methyltransferase [Lentimicrobiaceae bacterium]MCP4910881.1 protein-L-isoaspartate(D-aspartate) O-methyltransferase [Bacteroidota bacterium]MBT3453749.1 protein-L-isoaspartate(D-aspartate) O-methyltransferase [Lentimicrobiaceae bacterium]MBT3819526.1 protein-L-isoaspartate(D-aspartate) O-methyltransferase [Lentimicrobiaceae bacterium]MBT4061667.1 protein-L-isoaspartate(D-aspartate) O-methyltransferase [Lentimicrobiaceae bacterium]
MVDTYRHKGMRKRLVDSIRNKGISNENILSAMNRVPRHLFLDSSFLEFAYDDKPFPIGSGQTISQPYTVAFQTEILDVRKGQKVLEIGSGSGYQACVLEEIGAKVFSIERQKKLYHKTKEFISELGYKVRFFYGDGNKGVPSFAPYDRILITAAAPEISKELIKQLKPGGILVVPLGKTEIQTMIKITKLENGDLKEEEFGVFRFVPLLKNKAND